LSREVLGQLSTQSQAQPRTDVTSGEAGAIVAHGGQSITEVLGGAPSSFVPRTDSDLFTFLAGTQPSCTSIPQESTGERETGGAQSFTPPTQSGCNTLASPAGNASVPAPPGLDASDTSLAAPTTQELGFIMRAIQSFMTDLPKIELGDMSTRATRLLSWKANFEQALLPVGPVVRNWWRWCVQQAAEAHRRFNQARLQDREAIEPLEAMPAGWEQIDSWMRPKVLEAMPKVIQDMVTMRSRQGKIDDREGFPTSSS